MLLYRILSGSSRSLDLLIWLIVLIALVPLVLAHPRLGGHTFRPSRLLWRHVGVVSGIVAIFVWLVTRDLNSWRYAAIGDEYSFYGVAKGILAHGFPTTPFSQSGVYQIHPWLDSGYDALVMAVFGEDHRAWVLSSVVAAAIAIPGIYVIGHVLGGQIVAVVSSAIFAFGHYTFALAHVGYNNIHAAVPTIWAVALFLLAEQRRSRLLLYASGIAAGLGFYTFYSARATLLILLAFVLMQRHWWQKLRRLWPLAIGAAATITPLLVATGGSVITAMTSQAGAEQGSLLERRVSNLWIDGLAFHFSSWTSHWVSGPLLDPISGILLALGIAVGLVGIRLESLRLLLIWAAIALLVAGIFSPYDHPTVTRLHYCLPPLALLGGFGAKAAWRTARPVPARALPPVLVLLLGAVLLLNIYRFWVQMPRRMVLTREAVALGAFRSKACRSDARHTTIVAPGPDSLMRPMLASYSQNGPLPRLVDTARLDPAKPFDVGDMRCVIFASPGEAPSSDVLRSLNRHLPEGRLIDVFDGPRITRVTIFWRPPLAVSN